MVLTAFTFFDKNLGNAAAVEDCSVTHEFSKTICYNLKVSCLACRVESVLELVVSPAKCSSCVALGLTEPYVVACVVETAYNFIACMAVASP